MLLETFKCNSRRRSSLFTIDEVLTGYESLPESYLEKVEAEKRKWKEELDKFLEEKSQIERELLNNTEVHMDINMLNKEDQEFVKGRPNFNNYLKKVESFINCLPVLLEYNASHAALERKKKQYLIESTNKLIKNILDNKV